MEARELNLRRPTVAWKREPSERSKANGTLESSGPVRMRRSTRKWRERSVESKRVSAIRRW